MMNLNEFVEFYNEKGRCPNDTGRRKNKLNDKQLNDRYEKYLKSEQKKKDRFERLTGKDEVWEELKSNLDFTKCQFSEYLIINGLDAEEYELTYKAGPLFYIIDPAHVFGKGSYPHMKYDLDNVVPINRYSHSMLDQNRHPITGEHISNEEVRSFWKSIVGKEIYKILEIRSKKK